MKTIYEGKSKQSGIYKIINTKNNRIYIGSAKLFSTRLSQHLGSLRKGTHHNKFLQHDFNKCGEEVYEFHVLEVVVGSKEDRNLREQYWIDQYHDDQKECYNFRKKSAGKERKVWSNNPEETSEKHRICRALYWTAEKRQEQSERMINQWKDPEYKKQQSDLQSKLTSDYWKRPGYREKVCETRKIVFNTEEYKQGQRAGILKQKHCFKPKTYTLVNPQGKKVTIINLTQFCKQNNYGRSGFKNLLRGKAFTYEGWTSPKTCLVKPRIKTYEFINPNGRKVTITNLARYCRRNPHLKTSSFNKLSNGNMKSYKGWTKP